MSLRCVLIFTARRCGELLILFFIVITLLFVAHRATLTADDMAVLHPTMGKDLQEEARDLWGLDHSLPHQYVIYIKNVVRGKLGTSFYYQQDVAELLKPRILSSLLLTGCALVLALVIDVLNNRTPSLPVGMVLYGIPFLFIGLLFFALFSHYLGLVPLGGMRSQTFSELSLIGQFIDIIHHLVLPCAVMIIWSLFACSIVRASIGGSFKDIRRLFPPIMMTALSAGVLLFGLKITETMFGWPGIHKTVVEASLTYDYPLAHGAFVVAWGFSLVLSLCIEIFYLFRLKK